MPARHAHVRSTVNDAALDVFTQLSVSRCLSVPQVRCWRPFRFVMELSSGKHVIMFLATRGSVPIPQALLTLGPHGEGSCPQTARSLNTTSGLELPKRWAEHSVLGIFRDCLT